MAAVTGQVGETAAALDVDRDDLDLLLMIRRFEETLLDLFAQGKLNGTTHTCLGQEYVPVALRPLLRDDDFVFSNHRGHGHYLARFGDLEAARKIADPDERAKLAELHESLYDRNYPVEWTRLVARTVQLRVRFHLAVVLASGCRTALLLPMPI